MAIRFTDKPSAASDSKSDGSKPVGSRSEETSKAVGEARFATPIEAAQPVNPDAAGELPFGDLPRAEKAERKKRTPKPAAPR